MKPVEIKRDRIEQLDIIRGFALFGVLLVNLTMIDETLFSRQSSPFAYENLLERLFAILLDIFATGKFYSLFAILFGIGSVIFMQKFETDQEGVRFYKKRLFILFVIGIFHLVFVWYGDILHVYAIAGFIMMSKRHLTAKHLFIWSIVSFAISTVLFSTMMGDGQVTPEINTIVENSLVVYRQSNYLEFLKYRMTWELPVILINLIIVLPKIFALFFLGAAIGKINVFQKSTVMKGYLNKTFKFSLIASVVFSSSYMIFSSGVLGNNMLGISVVFSELLTISGALFYGSVIMLLTSKNGFLKKMRPLASVGKMALTNYLAQTIFFTTLLYGYGVGLFQKLPIWSYLPLALVFFVCQMVISSIWLRRYKQGPVEFIWRKFTYRQIR